jgi:hypothetical protein
MGGGTDSTPLTVEARYEGELSEACAETAMDLCKSYVVNTDDQTGDEFSRNVMTNDDDKIVVSWFWIKVANYDVAEELAVKLAGLGLDIGIDDPDNADLNDPRQHERNIKWLEGICPRPGEQ